MYNRPFYLNSNKNIEDTRVILLPVIKNVKSHQTHVEQNMIHTIQYLILFRIFSPNTNTKYAYFIASSEKKSNNITDTN